MKKFLIIIVVILAAAIGCIAFMGSRLPREHVATMTISFKAEPAAVWTAITDVRAYPSWRKDVSSVTLVSPVPLTWKEVGGEGEMNLTVEEWQPPRRMVATITDEGK